MIRLNLLRNRFQSASADPDTLGTMSAMSLDPVPSHGRRLGLALAAIVIVAAGGGAAWWFLLGGGEEETVAPPATAAPAAVRPDTSAKVAAKPDSALAPKTDSVQKADSAKASPEPKVAQAPKPAPEPPPPAPAPQPKPEPRAAVAPPTQVTPPPAVVAPALAGGVVNLVLSEATGKKAAGTAPTRFEDLSTGPRLAYQRFAFERILSVVRQVSGPSLRFSRIRIHSPGVVVLQGSGDSVGIRALVQGLLAQSMVDTAMRTAPGGQFAVVARLPFSASFGGASATGSPDFAKTALQARDLASAQSLELGAPRTPSIQKLPSVQRASWKLSGTGSWDAVDKWISALQSMGCPMGFTSLSLASGPDGKLRVEADAISYSR